MQGKDRRDLLKQENLPAHKQTVYSNSSPRSAADNEDCNNP